MTLRTWSIERSLVWALSGALAISTLALEAPAEAQRSSVSARRARAARRARIRQQRRIERRAAQSQPVDMDFTTPLVAMDDERPPPMDISYVREHEARTLERRRAALDPELFGERPTPDATPRERARFSPLTARAALRVFHRGLDYRDYAHGPVTPYVLPLGAGLAIGADYYPAAHFLNDAWAQVGLTWSLTHSLGVESVGPNGVGYPTTAYAWQLGVRVRVPLDEAGGELAFEAGGGEHGFRVERGHLHDPPPEGVPGADYDLLRLAISGRFMIGEASLGARVGYLPVLASGAIASPAYFGGAEVHGVEAGIELTYRLGLGFELLAELDARLFVLSFPEATDAPAAASGALDRSIGANLGLRWTMPSERQL